MRNATETTSLTGRCLVALVGVLAAAFISACASGPMVYEVVIPEGEWHEQTSQVLADLPQRSEDDGSTILLFDVGDTLTVANNDSVEHVIGLVAVRPGETVRHVFRQAGVFEGSCTLLTGERVLIEVS